MLKKIILFLLIANLGVLLTMSGWLDSLFGNGKSAGREPDRMNQQVKAETVTGVAPIAPGSQSPSASTLPPAIAALPAESTSAGTATSATQTASPAALPAASSNATTSVSPSTAPVAAAVSAPTNSPASASANVSTNASPNTNTAIAAPAPLNPQSILACTTFGAYSTDEAKIFEAALKPLNLGERLTIVRLEDGVTYMVYVPPFKSKAQADKAAAELKTLGVKDLMVFKETSPWKFGIGLGVFRGKEQAKAQLAKYEKMGVEGATVVTRNAELIKYFFEIKGLSGADINRLNNLKDVPALPQKKCEVASAAEAATK
jgi:cell division protein FtsN